MPASIALASDLPQRAVLRRALRMQVSLLTDCNRFMRDPQQTCPDLWRAWRARQPW